MKTVALVTFTAVAATVIYLHYWGKKLGSS